MRSLSTYLGATFIRMARIFSARIRRGLWVIRTLPHTCLHALQQPHVQYNIALLIATVLACLLGWPLFVSTLPHSRLAHIVYVYV